MYEVKSKRSGLPPEVMSDKEYFAIVEADKTRRVKLLDKFTVTEIKRNPIIPAFKNTPEISKPEKITPKNKKV